MNFKAIEIEDKPYIYWQSTDEPVEGIVVLEENIPANQFGICPLKIVAGELVARTTIEMNTAKDEFDAANFLQAQFNKIDHVNNGSFTYDSQQFPMDERSRVFYHSIDKLRGNAKLMTTTGNLYDLTDTATNIDDFLAAFYAQVKLLTQPDL
jgi:hypothetical protein